MVFILLAVVRVGKDGVSCSLLVLRLRFLQQHSPRKCNIGTCHRTPSGEQPINTLTAKPLKEKKMYLT